MPSAAAAWAAYRDAVSDGVRDSLPDPQSLIALCTVASRPATAPPPAAAGGAAAEAASGKRKRQAGAAADAEEEDGGAAAGGADGAAAASAAGASAEASEEGRSLLLARALSCLALYRRALPEAFLETKFDPTRLLPAEPTSLSPAVAAAVLDVLEAFVEGSGMGSGGGGGGGAGGRELQPGHLQSLLRLRARSRSAAVRAAAAGVLRSRMAAAGCMNPLLGASAPTAAAATPAAEAAGPVSEGWEGSVWLRLLPGGDSDEAEAVSGFFAEAVGTVARRQADLTDRTRALCAAGASDGDADADEAAACCPGPLALCALEQAWKVLRSDKRSAAHKRAVGIYAASALVGLLQSSPRPEPLARLVLKSLAASAAAAAAPPEKGAPPQQPQPTELECAGVAAMAALGRFARSISVGATSTVEEPQAPSAPAAASVRRGRSAGAAAAAEQQQPRSAAGQEAARGEAAAAALEEALRALEAAGGAAAPRAAKKRRGAAAADDAATADADADAPAAAAAHAARRGALFAAALSAPTSALSAALPRVLSVLSADIPSLTQLLPALPHTPLFSADPVLSALREQLSDDAPASSPVLSLLKPLPPWCLVAAAAASGGAAGAASGAALEDAVAVQAALRRCLDKLPPRQRVSAVNAALFWARRAASSATQPQAEAAAKKRKKEAAAPAAAAAGGSGGAGAASASVFSLLSLCERLAFAGESATGGGDLSVATAALSHPFVRESYLKRGGGADGGAAPAAAELAPPVAAAIDSGVTAILSRALSSVAAGPAAGAAQPQGAAGLRQAAAELVGRAMEAAEAAAASASASAGGESALRRAVAFEAASALLPFAAAPARLRLLAACLPEGAGAGSGAAQQGDPQWAALGVAALRSLLLTAAPSAEAPPPRGGAALSAPSPAGAESIPQLARAWRSAVALASAARDPPGGAAALAAAVTEARALVEESALYPLRFRADIDLPFAAPSAGLLASCLSPPFTAGAAAVAARLIAASPSCCAAAARAFATEEEAAASQPGALAVPDDALVVMLPAARALLESALPGLRAAPAQLAADVASAAARVVSLLSDFFSEDSKGIRVAAAAADVASAALRCHAVPALAAALAACASPKKARKKLQKLVLAEDSADGWADWGVSASPAASRGSARRRAVLRASAADAVRLAWELCAGGSPKAAAAASEARGQFLSSAFSTLTAIYQRGAAAVEAQTDNAEERKGGDEPLEALCARLLRRASAEWAPDASALATDIRKLVSAAVSVSARAAPAAAAAAAAPHATAEAEAEAAEPEAAAEGEAMEVDGGDEGTAGGGGGEEEAGAPAAAAAADLLPASVLSARLEVAASAAELLVTAASAAANDGDGDGGAIARAAEKLFAAVAASPAFLGAFSLTEPAEPPPLPSLAARAAPPLASIVALVDAADDPLAAESTSGGASGSGGGTPAAERRRHRQLLARVLLASLRVHAAAAAGGAAASAARWTPPDPDGSLIPRLLVGYGATLGAADRAVFALLCALNARGGARAPPGAAIATLGFLWGEAAARAAHVEPAWARGEGIAADALSEVLRAGAPPDARRCALTALRLPVLCGAPGEPLLAPPPLEERQDGGGAAAAAAGADAEAAPATAAAAEAEGGHAAAPEAAWPAAGYDPSFVLPFAAASLACKACDSRDAALWGLLPLALAALASADRGTRAAAYAVLSAASAAAEADSFRERAQLAALLQSVRNAVAAPLQRFPALSAVFAAEASCVVLHPDSDFYPAVTRFLLRKESLDLDQAPLFLPLFHSGSPAAWRQDRAWALRAARAGARTEADAQLLRRHFVAEIVMAFGEGALGDAAAKREALRGVLAALRLPSLAVYLVDHSAAVPWLAAACRAQAEAAAAAAAGGHAAAQEAAARAAAAAAWALADMLLSPPLLLRAADAARGAFGDAVGACAAAAAAAPPDVRYHLLPPILALASRLLRAPPPPAGHSPPAAAAVMLPGIASLLALAPAAEAAPAAAAGTAPAPSSAAASSAALRSGLDAALACRLRCAHPALAAGGAALSALDAGPFVSVVRWAAAAAPRVDAEEGGCARRVALLEWVASCLVEGTLHLSLSFLPTRVRLNPRTARQSAQRPTHGVTSLLSEFRPRNPLLQGATASSAASLRLPAPPASPAPLAPSPAESSLSSSRCRRGTGPWERPSQPSVRVLARR